MKLKHNKKRNTAFLFEVLVREITKSVVQKDTAYGLKVSRIVKEHFAKGTLLKKELDIYKSLQETNNLTPYLAEKMIFEAKVQYKDLDKDRIFEEQSSLIRKINKELSPNVFTQFIPNYRSIATIYQIFGDSQTPKKKVLLENTVMEWMTTKTEEEKENTQKIDKLVIKKFVERFNAKYNNDLLEEQRTLLQRYIMSFADNGTGLSLYLNEELGRLKKVIGESKAMKEITEDTEMKNNTEQVLQLLESFKQTPISMDMVKKVLKIQNLVSEMQS